MLPAPIPKPLSRDPPFLRPLFPPLALGPSRSTPSENFSAAAALYLPSIARLAQSPTPPASPDRLSLLVRARSFDSPSAHLPTPASRQPRFVPAPSLRFARSPPLLISLLPG